MRILDRYIAHHVMIATGLVMAVLMGLDSFMLFFAEMPDIGKAQYDVFSALAYVLMHLPFDLYQLFPMSGFLGCLIGLGRLASQRELIVMRASGMSIIAITFSVIKAAVVMLLLVTCVAEVLAPPLQLYSEHMKAVALAKEKNYLKLGGIWLRYQNNFMYVDHIDSATQLTDITLFELQGKQLTSMRYAPQATRLPDGSWLLSRVTETQLSAKQVVTQQLDQLTINIDFDPLVLSLGNKNIDELSVSGLYQSIKYRDRSGLNVEQYQLAFWQRIFQPIATIVMICLGVPFIFGSLGNASMGLRIVMGIVIGFIFYLLNQLLGPLAIVYQFSPIVAAMIPSVIFIMLCAILFRRIN